MRGRPLGRGRRSQVASAADADLRVLRAIRTPLPPAWGVCACVCARREGRLASVRAASCAAARRAWAGGRGRIPGRAGALCRCACACAFTEARAQCAARAARGCWSALQTPSQPWAAAAFRIPLWARARQLRGRAHARTHARTCRAASAACPACKCACRPAGRTLFVLRAGGTAGRQDTCESPAGWVGGATQARGREGVPAALGCCAPVHLSRAWRLERLGVPRVTRPSPAGGKPPQLRAGRTEVPAVCLRACVVLRASRSPCRPAP